MAKRKPNQNNKARRRRRNRHGLAKAAPKSQARGKRRPSLAKVSQSRIRRAVADAKLQLGLRLLRTEKSIAEAARKAGIQPSKLRAYAIKKKLLAKRGKRWVVQKDIPRKVLIYSDGREHAITVSKFKSASLIGEYMAAVRWFVQTNDLRHLEPFAGKSVKDISGTRFPLETRPNVLHRLASSGGDSFEQIYRIVV